jgi:hypothetical protein
VDILLHVAVAALYAAAAWVCRPGATARRRATPTLRAPRSRWRSRSMRVVIARTIVLGDGLDLSFVNALSLVSGSRCSSHGCRARCASCPASRP